MVHKYRILNLDPDASHEAIEDAYQRVNGMADKVKHFARELVSTVFNDPSLSSELRLS